MTEVLAGIGLGANLGDAANTVATALRELGKLPQTRLIQASRLYRTSAWGHVAQPDFINAAATMSTTLDAESLLQALLSIERRCGRVRDNEVRWGPRVLDLDLLLYGYEIIDRPGLQVPHPRLHQRAFALTPLAEIAPDLWIPGRGTVMESLRSLIHTVEAERIAVLGTTTSIETKQES